MKTSLTLALTLILTACAAGPDYKKPPMDIPASFREAGSWKPAAPRLPQSGWWEIYGDPVLTALEQQVSISNQNIKAAEAALREAEAAEAAARADFFPALSASASFSRGGKNGDAENSAALKGAASWAPDVWGRLRRQAESANAETEATKSDLAAATLSVQATLARTYFQLRCADVLASLRKDAAKARARAKEIAANQYKAGLVTKADLAAAEAARAQAEASALSAEATRRNLEHALAVLAGRLPATFSLVPAGDTPALPGALPGVLPAALLERRPDIAAAERRTAAANAKIGVAEAAYFPDITLSAAGGFEAAAFGGLIAAPHQVWSLGPAAALALFDGGARRAAVSAAEAARDRQAALYRQTVLDAFREAEDALSTLALGAQEEKLREDAARAAAESLRLATNQYAAGTTGFSAVLTAQTEELGARESSLAARQNRLLASVDLIAAIGGGW